MIRFICQAFLVCIGNLLIGCGTETAEEPIVDEAGNVAERTEVFRADAASKADGRHFRFSWGDEMALPDFHAQYVREFVRAPGRGISRMPIYFGLWELIEIIPEGRELDAADVRLYRNPHTGKTNEDAEKKNAHYLELDELIATPGGKFRRTRERVWIVS